MAALDVTPGERAAPETAQARPSVPEGSPVRARPKPLRRRPELGMLGGVCAGLGERFGLPPLMFRLLAAMVFAVGGLGVAVYALAWALIPPAPESRSAPRRWREAVLIVLAVAGGLAVLRAAGLALGVGALRSVYEIAWPLVLGVCGMALVWRLSTTGSGTGALRRPRSLRELVRAGARVDAPRLILGALLFAFAAASLLHTFGFLHSLSKAIWAVAIVATLLALLIVPWFLQVGRSLASERAARIREQARAEMAAHLHDSVLQTLALIQKRAADPREVAGLARRQERELRRWLFERHDADARESLVTALERIAAEVEELHRVPIEVVTVGDAPLDERLDALVQAAREALTNAAKFCGCDRVDLYAQVDPRRVEVFVRDRGVGFDPAAVPADRRGVRDSIIGRVARHNGHAAVHSTPGGGTEVELILERSVAA
jgi:signal transduction histidine kinase/phage shock protein PspC (stress-responsive transcriptional regulator)